MEKILFTTYTEEELEALFGRAISKYIPVTGNQPRSYNNKKWLPHLLAAEYLSITPAALYGKTSKREIKYHKIGKENRYAIEDLDAYLNRNGVKTMYEIKSELQLQPRRKYSLTNKTK